MSNSYFSGTISGSRGKSASQYLFIGGVVGFTSAGILKIENNAALTPSIAHPDGVIARIWHEITFVTVNAANNHARSDMLINGDPFTGIGTLTNQNGQDIALDIALTPSFWSDTMGWSEEVWEFTNGKLPILRNVGSITEIIEIGVYGPSPTEATVVEVILKTFVKSLVILKYLKMQTQ